MHGKSATSAEFYAIETGHNTKFSNFQPQQNKQAYLHMVTLPYRQKVKQVINMYLMDYHAWKV